LTAEVQGAAGPFLSLRAGPGCGAGGAAGAFGARDAASPHPARGT